VVAEGIYWFQPWRLWVDETVQDTLGADVDARTVVRSGGSVDPGDTRSYQERTAAPVRRKE
jgi:hypothetical protein